MKTLLRLLFIYIPAGLLIVCGAIAGIIWQQQLISAQDLQFLSHLGRTQGMGAVYSVISAEITGNPQGSTDPSYGRRTVAGRGHAPWVIRSNLDGRPRVISFALAPGIWAAYDTESASLYQVWQGDVLFQGAAYDQRHGPQPVSVGAWYLRDETPGNWYIQVPDSDELLPARVRYLGHEYSPGMRSAGVRFVLEAAGYRLELLETPEIENANGLQLLRRTVVHSGDEALKAIYRSAAGADYGFPGTQVVELQTTTPLPVPSPVKSWQKDEADAAGLAVIQNSDCLGCHGESHRVAGPSWSRVAGRFRGRLNDEVISALAESILDGSEGKWGSRAMPPHPGLSEEEARAAGRYILTRPESGEEANPPLDSEGVAYGSTWSVDSIYGMEGVHPAFSLENLLPEGFEPKVGGLDFLPDGRLVVASWDPDGAVFIVDLTQAVERRVVRIAEGLHEPLGLAVVEGRIFVLQKQELTELIDRDGDDVIDVYRSVSYDWPSSSNFHSFAFGLHNDDDAFYMLLSVCVLPGGASCPDQLPTQGKMLRISMADGSAEVFASGFRTPNGIGLGPDGDLFVTDNQGDWLPANKLIHVEQGGFYGFGGAVATSEIKAPVVWLPQDEIGNSPTQPLLMIEGPYAGQMIHGDVYNGGIKRVYLEKVAGRWQGAAMHFSAGLQGAVNRLVRGPDGAIYVGEIGNPPNWGLYGKSWFGLERLSFTDDPAFEILRVQAEANGFTLVLSEALADDTQLEANDLLVRQWFYHPNEQYGGPKYDYTELAVAALEISTDRRSISARIPGLKAGYVVYLRLNDSVRSSAGEKLWAGEAWYTLNNIPAERQAERADGWIELFDGQSLAGWRNYGGEIGAVDKWQVNNGVLELTQGRLPMWRLIKSYLFGGASGDLIYYKEKFRNFELSLEWKISENGNSGIFYLVADEEHNVPWLTGIEMQVLDNEGHDDGQNITHRAGDLYGLVAATPETVRPPGQWNEVLIRVKDDHIEHWLNGVKVVSIVRGGERWQRLLAHSKFADMPEFGKTNEGFIVLQDHGDLVWYRNIRVRKLVD